MNKEGIMYKFQDGYILLEDLESWYSRGLVTAKDEIRIFKKNCKKCVLYNVGSLIRTYGSEFPFRFGEKHYVYNREKMLEIKDDCTEKMSFADWDWELKKKLDRSERQEWKLNRAERNENVTFVYLDFPLYNVNDLEDDMITGSDVVDEMEKLRNSYVLRNWCLKYRKFFSFLCRYPIDDNQDSVALCRICHHTPFGPVQFFEHLFSSSHIQNLAKRKISRSSFQYWTNKFEKCIWIHGEQRGCDIEKKFWMKGKDSPSAQFTPHPLGN